MTRIHPDYFPDRFALQHYAQRKRREETGRMLHAIADWVHHVAAHAAHPAPAPARVSRRT